MCNLLAEKQEVAYTTKIEIKNDFTAMKKIVVFVYKKEKSVGVFMKKVILHFKKLVKIVYNTFPIFGGFSVKDADELMKDPDNYNYRGNSWSKKMDNKLFKSKK